MSLPYFFIENIIEDTTIVLPENTSKHCIQVLRMKTGEQLQLTDGKGNLVTAHIINADKKKCLVAIKEKNYQPLYSKRISIAMSLLRNPGRFEWFLEKVTEIGVSEIIPMICLRTERQNFRFERMNNILIAAMLQSEQTWLPVLHQPKSLEKIISLSGHKQKLIAHCENNGEKNNIASLLIESETQILIGPEGDFTSEEIKRAEESNFVPVSLGRTRLRSETAGIVAATLIMNSYS